MKFKIVVISLALVIVISTAVGFGYWRYSVNKLEKEYNEYVDTIKPLEQSPTEVESSSAPETTQEVKLNNITTVGGSDEFDNATYDKPVPKGIDIQPEVFDNVTINYDSFDYNEFGTSWAIDALYNWLSGNQDTTGVISLLDLNVQTDIQVVRIKFEVDGVVHYYKEEYETIGSEQYEE